MSVNEETIVETAENDSAEAGFSEQRGAPVRSTVARKCREFYLRRLERTETLQRRWSLCAPASVTTVVAPASKKDGFPKVDDPGEEDSSSGVESEGSCGEGFGVRRGEMVKRADSGASVNSSTNSDRDDGEKTIVDENKTDETRSRVEDGGSDLVDVPSDKSSRRTGNQPAPPPPLRKWNSTFDLAMDNLRREITSLIAQDNDLFRQLLSLNDSIGELREQQKRNLELSQQMDEDDDEIDDEEDFDESRHYSLSDKESLESLSDQDTSATTPSPASTLSSSCSSHYAPNIIGKGKTPGSCGLSSKRPALPSSMRNGSFHHHHHHHRHHSTSSNLCLRCHSSGKMAMPLLRRRAHSQASLHWKRDDFDSYDSGIHLQGAHSDSDHEIFV